jgi:phosphopantothenoylcysteine decarboxylase/phosphopantothenate--cysteine ligase
MNPLQNKHIVLGVSGGIAAYKSVELLRLIVKKGANARVMMTQNAKNFVGPITFETLSGQRVCVSLFDPQNDAAMNHIDWADAADAVVIAPATANIIGKLATGIADDALSTFLMVVTCPVIVCPSMNTNMYQSRAVQRNLNTLKKDGYIIVEPGSGELACRTIGPGRLPDPPDILDTLIACLTPKDLKNKRILVTAGPTQEPIDPVRFISNPSSGKMGFAIARAAAHRGGDLILITGPTALEDLPSVKTIRVQTAREMASAVFEQVTDCDVIIKTAAVSDYRPKTPAVQKIKKNKKQMVLHLEQTQDILKEIGKQKTHQILVGFAAETEALEKSAQKKLKEKNLDIIVGNRVDLPDSGFKSDTNTVTLFYKDGTTESLPTMDKEAVAQLLLDRIVAKMND